MIIDTSNAPCGPGSIPGLRLSESRPQSIGDPASPRLGRRGPSGPRPLKCRPGGRSSPTVAPLPGSRPGEASEPALRRAWRGCLWTPCLSAASARAPDSGRRTGASEGTLSAVASQPSGRPHSYPLELRPQIRRDDPLNLSILLSGGKETNKDSPSSGERRGKSPAPNPRPRWAREMWRTGDGRRPGVDRGPESF